MVSKAKPEDHKCRYCGRPATRWSGIPVKRVLQDMTVEDLGILYSCETCNPAGKWPAIGDPVQLEKFTKQPRTRRKRVDEERYNDMYRQG